MTAVSNNARIFGKISNKRKMRLKQQNLVILVSNVVFKLAVKLSSYKFSCRTTKNFCIELIFCYLSNFRLEFA